MSALSQLSRALIWIVGNPLIVGVSDSDTLTPDVKRLGQRDLYFIRADVLGRGNRAFIYVANAGGSKTTALDEDYRPRADHAGSRIHIRDRQGTTDCHDPRFQLQRIQLGIGVIPKRIIGIECQTYFLSNGCG